jgi:hypothetical protein
MQDFLVYPAIFEYADDGINIWFPDLDEAFTCAHSDVEALRNAVDVLEWALIERERAGQPAPAPTPAVSISLQQGQVVSLLRANLRAARIASDARAIRKTLTIPKWLNEQAEAAGVNFSQVLQAALKEVLGLPKGA